MEEVTGSSPVSPTIPNLADQHFLISFIFPSNSAYLSSCWNFFGEQTAQASFRLLDDLLDDSLVFSTDF